MSNGRACVNNVSSSSHGIGHKCNLDGMGRRELAGSSVVVAGAGLAGLSAARALEARGAAVTLIEARARVGGRVWTLRDGFAGGQHAEAGADLIEEEQEHVLTLARELGLKPFKAAMRGFRGFFLADPEDLSMLPLVEQFAESGTPGQDQIFRIPGGNDRLATGIAKRLRGALLCETIVRRIDQRAGGVSVTVEDRTGRRSEISADYLVCAVPASTAREIVFEPALPAPQCEAIAHLRYGCATRLLLQFDRRFWKKARRPLAFGTDLPTGAVWDGNEQQRGPNGILSFLAGGGASRALQEIVGDEGHAGVIARIDWLGKPSALVASRTIVWEDDPWARGGYAYFDPGFDPLWRAWLARPAGRIVFAGEHTSIKSQGYMNGAIETGLRAAAEVAALSA